MYLYMQGQPNPLPAGVSTILLDDGWGYAKPDGAVNDTGIRAAATRAKNEGKLYVLDFENPQHFDLGNLEHLGRIQRVCQIARATGAQVGVYDLPRMAYWRCQFPYSIGPGYDPSDPSDRHIYPQRRINEALRQALSGAITHLCPSLYTFYEQGDGWGTHFGWAMAECARYANGTSKKHIAPFLWPHYHESSPVYAGVYPTDPMKLVELPGDYWEFQCRLAQWFGRPVVWGKTGRPFDAASRWWGVCKRVWGIA